MTRIKCFMLHETDRAWRSLRRYESREGRAKCPGPLGYHNAHNKLGVVSGFTKDAENCWRKPDNDEVRPPPNDPRWPLKCDHCEYVFDADDEWQVFDEHIHITDDGREMSLRNSPPGAMWFADWMGDWAKGSDGHCLVVKCPDGREWMIDGQASNCTMPNDRGPHGEAHRCWIRHGTPPLVSVDKNGKTCGAGAGSIDTKHKYHGFLGTHGAQPGEFT